MASRLPQKTLRLLAASLSTSSRASCATLSRKPSSSSRMAHEAYAARPGLNFTDPQAGKEDIKVEWVTFEGRVLADSRLDEGETLLNAARAKGIELEGACDGKLACSTCHVVLEQRAYELLEGPSEQEEDLLDLAHGLERCSRLGCQVKLSGLRPITNKVTVKLPNVLVDSDSKEAVLPML